MARVGIERLSVYAGSAAIDVRDIFVSRALNLQRFDNLMMRRKSVALPWEDPVTHAVNAAKPLCDDLEERERRRIEMIIVATESGVDFGKSLSTYVHRYLGLHRRCRLFELKQACYGATAALTLAASYVVANADTDPKVLIIAADVARAADQVTYAEPSQGSGAVAFLVGGSPEILELDFGASGIFGYEVMDTCRPSYVLETGDPDLSLFSYLDCLERCFEGYAERVDGVDVMKTFAALAFHTPFAGMVRGAHRKLLRKLSTSDHEAIERDFSRRVAPGLEYCMQVGNLYSASLYLALASLIDNTKLDVQQRVGLFSYGSGCSSEFFSGIVGPASQALMARMGTRAKLEQRYALKIEEYDAILSRVRALPFGVPNLDVDRSGLAALYERSFAGRGLLVLENIREYQRNYAWS